MSYQVLARKYRPATFQQLEGQEHVLQALINALDQNRLHHAYLFTGTRGVGKTTIARIIAKCFNCHVGVTSTPCGECNSCLEIAGGRSVDLIEVDAASRTGVDDMRELLDNVQYMPTTTRFKVYLIDEVHMLSRNSFNAMLKTLEEPPEHVKFLFATTDPRKLPVTVLSRCLQFNLKNLSPEQIVHYLQDVLHNEDIVFEEAALWQLARAADGSMRDALSFTDQAISFCDNELTDTSVRSMLGNMDQHEIYGLLDALVDRDAEKVLSTIADMANYAPDFSALLDDLLGVLHRISIAQFVPDAVDNSQGDKEQVLAVADKMSKEDVQLLYQIGVNGQKDMPFAPDDRRGFEMTLLRMLAFTPLDPEELVINAAEGGGVSASNSHAAKNAGRNTGRDTTRNTGRDSGRGTGRKSGEDNGSKKVNKIDSDESPFAAIMSSLQDDAVDGRPKRVSDRPGQIADGIGKDAGRHGQDSVQKEQDKGKEDEQVPETDQAKRTVSVGTPTDSSVPPIADDPTTSGPVKAPEPTASSPELSVPEPSAEPAPELSAEPAPEPSVEPAPEPSASSPELSAPEPEPEPEPVPVPSVPATSAAPMAVMDITGRQWFDIVDRLNLSGVTRTMAVNCSMEEMTGDRIKLKLEEGHASLWNKNRELLITQALDKLTGHHFNLSIEIGLPGDETPAQLVQRQIDDSNEKAMNVIQNDAVIKTLISRFNGRIDKDSIRPIQTGDQP